MNDEGKTTDHGTTDHGTTDHKTTDHETTDHGQEPFPVVLVLPAEPERLMGLPELVAQLKDRFILLAPARRLMGKPAEALLAGMAADVFRLEENLAGINGGPHPARGTTLSQPMGAGQTPARFVFRKAGSFWDVVFDGGEMFHLAHTLGAEYLDYLLHHPGEPISAFDLELLVRPDKRQARAKDSVQSHLDATAARAYLQQLDRLRHEREEAAEDGDLAVVDRLDRDIEAIESALKCPGQASDAGERSRGNVSKAVQAVLRKLRRGDVREKAFAEHLGQYMSFGYECCYHHPLGNPWG